jgi:hypothetical protein
MITCFCYRLSGSLDVEYWLVFARRIYFVLRQSPIGCYLSCFYWFPFGLVFILLTCYLFIFFCFSFVLWISFFTIINCGVIVSILCRNCIDTPFNESFHVNSPLDVNEKDECALDFALYLSCLFSVSLNLYFPCMAHVFLPKRSSNHCQGLHLSCSEICTKFDAVPLSGTLQNHITTPNKRT